MKTLLVMSSAVAVASLFATTAFSQPADTPGAAQPAAVAAGAGGGLSVSKQLLGRTVQDSAGKRVGTVEDLIVSPSATAVAIVSVGGLIGDRSHRVAIPIDQLVQKRDGYILPASTKVAVEHLPKFTYSAEARKMPPIPESSEH